MRGNLKMTLTIDLTPEIEAKLRDEAAKEGLDPDRYVLHTLTERWGQPRETDPPHLSRAESELLQRINEGLPAETWRQYHDLIAKRRAETLTPEQHKALIELSDQVEMDYARRLESVLELAHWRGTSLEAQMQKLGIPQYSYE